MTHSEIIANLKMIKVMLDDNEQVEVINETINTACEIIRADENRQNEVSIDWKSEIQSLKDKHIQELHDVKEQIKEEQSLTIAKLAELDQENMILKAKLEVVELIFGNGKLDYGQIQNKRV